MSSFEQVIIEVREQQKPTYEDMRMNQGKRRQRPKLGLALSAITVILVCKPLQMPSRKDGGQRKFQQRKDRGMHKCQSRKDGGCNMGCARRNEGHHK
jgi:hypothetical protein